MITGKELWIDGLNEGIITFYKEQLFEDEDLPNLIIETTRRNDDTYETAIKCLYTIENYVSAKCTTQKLIVKTYITR